MAQNVWRGSYYYILCAGVVLFFLWRGFAFSQQDNLVTSASLRERIEHEKVFSDFLKTVSGAVAVRSLAPNHTFYMEGSGFRFGESLVVTANHVVNHAYVNEISLDYLNWIGAEILYLLHTRDIAFLDSGKNAIEPYSAIPT